MTSEQTIHNVMGKALWDPHPTTNNDLQCRQLAHALGYPDNWRVVRKYVDYDGVAEAEAANDDEARASRDDDDADAEKPTVLVDRIYAGEPGSGCDMWYHHAGAMAAAAEVMAAAAEAAANDETTNNRKKNPLLSTPLYAFRGGHMLPLQPKFEKHDLVQVLYHEDEKWYDGKILKRKEYPGLFKYQVQYDVDASRQGGVEEDKIRHRPAELDPFLTATNLGFGEGWKAYSGADHHWKVVSPDGTIYKSKKRALDAYFASKVEQEQEQATVVVDEGDPPWRTTGHEYIGRRILWNFEHKVSARRQVTITQYGTVTGWISETDVDKDGQPGFVSEQTQQPARLYHIVFDEDRQKHLHMYAEALLAEQDLEEYELLDCLLPLEEKDEKDNEKKRKQQEKQQQQLDEPSKKKQRLE